MRFMRSYLTGPKIKASTDYQVLSDNLDFDQIKYYYVYSKLFVLLPCLFMDNIKGLLDKILCLLHTNLYYRFFEATCKLYLIKKIYYVSYGLLFLVIPLESYSTYTLALSNKI